MMGVKTMESNISVHLKCLYLFVFGLYFGFFVLLYCNCALWWKMESNDLSRPCNDSHSNSGINEGNDIVHAMERFKRSQAYSRRSMSSNNAADSGFVNECALLTNICENRLKVIPGTKGEKGDSGSTGQKGEYGISGMTGPMGPPGPKGDPGRYGAKGDKGGQGHPGLLGFPGFKGDEGFPGEKGEKGDRGIIGPMGPKGIAGRTGQIGEPGEDGIPGKRGRRGYSGPPGPTGSNGIDGLEGPPGPTGDKGDTGERGETGYGINCNCPRGEKGDKGQRGLIGFTGYKGDKGDIGQKGNQGFGLRGQKGDSGKPGGRGERGDKGPKGDCLVSSPIAMESWRINSDSPSATVRTEHIPIEPKTTDTTTPLTTTKSTFPTTLPKPALPPRTKDITIEMIGIPLFLRQSGPKEGCWMRDTIMPNNYYVTHSYYGRYVYQFSSSLNFASAQIDRTHDLDYYHYYGNSHVVYNGSLYYQRAGENKIARFNFALGTVDSYEPMHGASCNDSNYLYTGSHVYFDIEVDENGMWIIYRKPLDPNSTYITKMDHLYMHKIKTWRLDVNSREYGNGFVAGGILYLIKDNAVLKTGIDFAYDLYKDRKFTVPKKGFINPYRFNTMVNYYPQSNPNHSRLLSWDNGVQIEYQLLFKGY